MSRLDPTDDDLADGRDFVNTAAGRHGLTSVRTAALCLGGVHHSLTHAAVAETPFDRDKHIRAARAITQAYSEAIGADFTEPGDDQ